jgi:hypothetical protein
MTLFIRRGLLSLIASLCPVSAFACEGMLHIEIEHTGVYSLDHASIVAQQPGFADCSSDALYMTNAGTQVPIRVVDSGNGRFGDGDRIEWVGQQLHGKQSWLDPFSINNVYLLAAAPGAHARIRDAEPEAEGSGAAVLQRVLHFEQDNLMIRLDQNQQKPGEEPDVWQWAKITHADPKPFEFTFDLPDLDSRSGTVAIRMNFRGLSRAPVSLHHDKIPDHAADISFNGSSVGRVSWGGRDEIVHEINVPASLLKARGNSVRLVVPKRSLPWDDKNPLVDVVMFNWAEFRFNVTGDMSAGALPFATRDPKKPIQIKWRGDGSLALYGLDGLRRTAQVLPEGRRRFASAQAGVEQMPVIDGKLNPPLLLRPVSSANWRQPGQGYDYLIVTHSTLRDAIAPLAAFHERRGLKVATLNVDEVYDTFNFGIPHPQAIRNLVAYARENWPQPQPRFLLLVGDASFDIRNSTSDDLRYAKFANNPHELAYSGHFSGIPATPYKDGSASFAQRNLIPTWQYPSPEGQSASDNPYGSVGDSYHPVVAVGRFPVVEPAEVTAIVDKTIDYMTKPQPGAWRRDVMFITDESDYFKKASDEIADSIGQQGFLADKIYASTDEANNLAHQNAIKDGLNEGQLLVHFIGHGGRYIWRTGPPDIRKNHDLFTLDDVSGLTNSGRLPMVLSMTCYSAPFDNPTEDSIGERFLREADKGAVAVFAASWRNAPSTAFSKSLVSELLTPGATIGEGIVRAKGSINDRVLVEMYNLLGDPAIVLKRPSEQAQLALDTGMWDSGVLVALPGTRFQGQVAFDWLDKAGYRLSTTTYSSDQTRFRMPIPKFAEGKTASAVRVYATDEISGRDATAGIDLTPAVVPRAMTLQERWASWFRPKPKPPAADTISRSGFDDHDVPAALVAGN